MQLKERGYSASCEVAISGPDFDPMAAIWELGSLPLEVSISPAEYPNGPRLLLRSTLAASRPVGEHVSETLVALSRVRPALIRATAGADRTLVARTNVEIEPDKHSLASLSPQAMSVLRDLGLEPEFHVLLVGRTWPW
jgi:hypothetical protein